MPAADLETGSSWSEMVAVAYAVRRRALIAFALPIVAAILVILFMDPIYRAESDIVVKTGREYLAEGAGETTPSAPETTKEEVVNSEIELLNSQALAAATINAIGLRRLYPDLGVCPPWFGVIPDFVDCPPFSGTVLDRAVKTFQQYLKVEPVKMSNAIEITYDADSPEQAKYILNQFVHTYQTLHAEAFANRDVAGYQTALQDFLKKLDALERQRTKIKVDNGIYDIAVQRAALIDQRVEAEAKLQDTLSRKSTLEQSITYLVRERASVPSEQPSLEMEHANNDLVDLEETESELATHDGPGNPELQRVQRQLSDMRAKMRGMKGEMGQLSATPSPLAEQIDEQLVADRAELVPLADEFARDQALVKTLSGELSRLEKADLDLRTVETRIDSMNAVLQTAEERYNKARSEHALDRTTQVSVVPLAPVFAPGKPYAPRPVLYTLGGILAGLLLAGGVIVARLATNTKITVERSVERLTGLPVLAAIPNLGPSFGAALPPPRQTKDE